MTNLPIDPSYSQIDTGGKDPKQGRSQVAALFVDFIATLNYLRNLLGSDGTASTARTHLGLKALATLDTIGSAQIEFESIQQDDLGDASVTLSKHYPYSQGSGLLGFASSGSATRIAGGTLGHFMRSNGSSAPSFAAIPGSETLHTETFGPVNYDDGDSETFSFSTSFGHRNYVCALYAKCTSADLSYEVGDYIEIVSGFVIARNQASAIVRVASDGLKARQENDHASEANMTALNDGKWQLYSAFIGA